MLAPLRRRQTYQGGLLLLIGAALVLPFGSLGAVLMVPLRLDDDIATIIGMLLGVALAAAVGFLPVTRSLERTAARELLGIELPGDARTGTVRETGWRTATWIAAHLGLGAIVVIAAIVLIWLGAPALSAPFRDGERYRIAAIGSVPTGAGGAWVPIAIIAMAMAVIYLIAGAAAIMSRLAPTLLGATPGERIIELERRTSDLANRNRLARELHDSVGHSLSVVTVQAGAAGRVLDSDSEFVRKALTAIEESARTALEDLDHVLGLLREERGATAPTPTLRELGVLVESMRSAGVAVECKESGDLDTVPPSVSREAYRIAQEGLTNVLRHAGTVPVTMHITVDDNDLELSMANPVGAQPPRQLHRRGGRGIAGIRERVAILGGEIDAGIDSGDWRLVARLPLRTLR